VFYPILKAALENYDPTHFTLIYTNRHEDSIILKDELEDLHSKYPDRFLYKQVISSPKNVDNLGDVHIGHITPELLVKYLPIASEDAFAINMGPKGMNEAFADIILNHTEYDPHSMVMSKAVIKMLISR
jgi:cytochrome-b5 reductase